MKSMKNKKAVEETKEQVPSAQLVRIKVKIEDIVQDEFVMRPKTRSRVKQTQEEVAPQAVVEISEDRQVDNQDQDKVYEVKGPEIVQPNQEEDITQPERGVMHYEEEDPKMTKMKATLYKYQMRIAFLKKKNKYLK